MKKVIWKDIEGYEGYYQISNSGIIKSLQRISASGKLLKEKIMKPINNGGYDVVWLVKDGNKKMVYVNNLTFKTFKGATL
jgi:hypothetical protein